jgi:hypothetical protein
MEELKLDNVGNKWVFILRSTEGCENINNNEKNFLIL